MTYCTKQDLISRFGEDELITITDHKDTGLIVDVVLDLAIADAAAEIDSYIGARYSLPLNTTPAVLTIYACDITRYRLYDDRTIDEVKDRYDRAIKWLKMISEGKATLGVESSSEDEVAHNVETRQGVSQHDWDAY